MQYGFGVDIGGTTIKIGLFSVDGDLMEKWEIPTNKTDNGKYILTEIANFINRTIEKKDIEKSDVMGVGLGVPGPVNKNGFVSVCVNLGWNSLNVEKEFHEIWHWCWWRLCFKWTDRFRNSWCWRRNRTHACKG